MIERISTEQIFSATNSAIKQIWFFCLSLAMFGLCPELALSQISLTVSDDMVLDTEALIFPDTAKFSRYPNGSPFRTEPLLTFGNYQFATWYHAGDVTNTPGNFSDENIYIARRKLTGADNDWYIRDTGQQMTIGDNSTGWDSHNVISMGVSSDGRIHLAYDMHNDDMRYLSSQAGRATTSNDHWKNTTTFTVFNAERDSLNPSGTKLTNVTYPRFINKGDDMLLTYRKGGSGNGDTILARYDSDGSNVSSRWVGATQKIIDGKEGSYTSLVTPPGMTPIPSNNRNAYLNGMDVGPDEKIHMTWTWREHPSGSNHDINYAYSDDNGATWKNNAGTPLGSTIDIESAGIIVEPHDLQQALANQQGQAVDNEGGVHALMYHRRDDKPYESGDGLFHKNDSSEYYHHYRNPDTGMWSEAMLPDDRVVGSRPSIGFDSENNLYAAYLTRFGGNDILRIAGAEKLASGGYDDWEVLLEDLRDWSGTPFLDQTRLLDNGILSIYLQEDTSSAFRSGTNLHVLEYSITMAVPEPGSIAVLSALSLALLSRRRKRRKI